MENKREIKFEYGFESVNGIVKKVYHLHEIPNIKEICDVWNVLPIMYVRQFTGLKDGEGKEIYDGDVVCFYKFTNNTFKVTGIVKYCSEIVSFIINCNSKYENIKGDYYFVKGIKYTVIGNIYENPNHIK